MRTLAHPHRLLQGLTAGALVFQFGHLIEHTLQMAVWFVHPQRSPWMSPWATDLALSFGRIPAADSAEMTTAMQRGMEVLHLVGNAIFLVGAVGLMVLLARRDDQPEAARSWAQAGVVLQAVHTCLLYTSDAADE